MSQPPDSTTLPVRYVDMELKRTGFQLVQEAADHDPEMIKIVADWLMRWYGFRELMILKSYFRGSE